MPACLKGTARGFRASSPAPSGCAVGPVGAGVPGSAARWPVGSRGNTITVNGTDSTYPTTLNVTDRTRVHQARAGSDTQAIHFGQVHGPRLGNPGTVAAPFRRPTINLRAHQRRKVPRWRRQAPMDTVGNAAPRRVSHLAGGDPVCVMYSNMNAFAKICARVGTPRL